MDFVVCGMPRGGTTFLGQMFNTHKDVYCYFMETGLFRQLNMLGRDRPFPAENLPHLEQWLRSEFRPVLVEGTEASRVAKFRRLTKFKEVLNSHGLEEVSGPGIRVWDEQTFEVFLADVMELFRQGLFGTPLFAAGMDLLSRHFKSVTRRPVLGEKTPDNLFFLEQLHAAKPRLNVFCIVREPYSTIESMKRRASREHPIFDTAFSKEVLGGVAEYYRNISAIYAYSLQVDAELFQVIRYEDVISNPQAVMERAFRTLGLDATDASREILAHLIMPTLTQHTKALDLTPTEYRLIEMILGPMIRHFGYEDGQGVPVQGGECDFKEGVIPLSGFYLQDGIKNELVWNWMAKAGDLFVLFRKDRKKLLFTMGCNFPAELGLDKVVLSISSGGSEVARFELEPAQDEFTIELGLEGLASQEASEEIRGIDLRLSSSASYTPITLIGIGADIREFSFVVKSCVLE